MKRRSLLSVMAACSILAAGLSAPGNAKGDLFDGAWWGPFGSSYYAGGYYYAGYSPGYYAGYYPGYVAGYAPTYTTYYYGGYGRGCCRPVRSCYPSCNPCGTCNPCASLCNPCATSCSPCQSACATCGAGGSCAIPSGGNESPQTFKKEGSMKPPIPMNDSKFNPRKENKTFKETPDEKKKGRPFPNGSEKKQNGEKREAFKPPTPMKDEKSGAIIQKKKPAPAKPPVEGTQKQGSQKTAEPKIDRLNLDDTITWKPTRRKTRLVIEPNIPSARIVRSVVDPNAGWKPVDEADTKLVRK